MSWGIFFSLLQVDYTKANRAAVKDASSMNHMKKMHDAALEKDLKAKPVQRVPSQRGNAPGTAFGAPNAGPPPVGTRGAAPNGKNYVKDNKMRAASCRPAMEDKGPSEHEKLMNKQVKRCHSRLVACSSCIGKPPHLVWTAPLAHNRVGIPSPSWRGGGGGGGGAPCTFCLSADGN